MFCFYIGFAFISYTINGIFNLLAVMLDGFVVVFFLCSKMNVDSVARFPRFVSYTIRY